MTRQQIDQLVATGSFPEESAQRELIETHISWVVLCTHHVYKIKKPVHNSFLDFSSLDQRHYYCSKEVELNQRLTTNIYLGIEPVREMSGRFIIGGDQGEIIDYAVHMRKIDRNREMDTLLLKNEVPPSAIDSLARKIASFHKNATIVSRHDPLDIQTKFQDLEKEEDYLQHHLSMNAKGIVHHAISVSDAFMASHLKLLDARVKAGFFRDCHGDLHSGNIFLLPDPQPFDCIEFNDDYRQIDVLNEVAFLCMDLDSYGREDLSQLFLENYLRYFPAMTTSEDRKLFIYYKCYRANIRAKVYSLRSREVNDDKSSLAFLSLAGKYLRLMDQYSKLLTVSPD